MSRLTMLFPFISDMARKEGGVERMGKGRVPGGFANESLSGNVDEENSQNICHEMDGFNMDRRLLGEGAGEM